MGVADCQRCFVVHKFASAVIIASLTEGSISCLIEIFLKICVLGRLIIVALCILPCESQTTACYEACEGSPLNGKVVGDVGVVGTVLLTQRSIIEGIGRQVTVSTPEVYVVVEHLDDFTIVVIGSPIGIQSCVL